MKPPPRAGTRRVDVLPLEEILPAIRNPKSHSLDGIAASIRRFGFADLVVLDERTGRLVSGHGRVEAVQRLRDKGEDPPDGVQAKDGRWCLPVIRGWESGDDAEAEAMLLASNRHGEVGGWDRELLAEVVGDLAAFDVDLVRAAGYDELDQHDLLAEFDGSGRGQAPPGEFPVVAPGDGSYQCPNCRYEWTGSPRP